jgi:hypothetical protein
MRNLQHFWMVITLRGVLVDELQPSNGWRQWRVSESGWKGAFNRFVIWRLRGA